jgi:hypothetical protein
MNELFTTAEDSGIHIFYQDTDSGHYYKKDIAQLRQIYNKKYNRELIGKNLGQFHSDFAEIDKGIESIAAKSIFVGKKSYIDMLTNEKGSVAFHCRLKGVKQDVIAITANEIFNSSEFVKVKYDEKSGLFVPDGKYNNDSKNPKTFVENRHDQSVLSLLLKYNKIPIIHDINWKNFNKF